MAEDGEYGIVISRQPLPRSALSTGTHDSPSRRRPEFQALESVPNRQAVSNNYIELIEQKDLVIIKNNNESPKRSPNINRTNQLPERPSQKSRFVVVAVDSKHSKKTVLKVVKREISRNSDTSVTSQTPLHIDGRDLCPYCGNCRCDLCRDSNELPRTLRCGSCVFSPEDILNRCTCVCCVRGLFYHCAEDTDEDYRYADEPCSCNSHKRCLRYTAMGLLSLVLPCLCCYWPARGCLECCRLCKARGRKGCECIEKDSAVL